MNQVFYEIPDKDFKAVNIKCFNKQLQLLLKQMEKSQKVILKESNENYKTKKKKLSGWAQQ